jgi:hypothetical protein
MKLLKKSQKSLRKWTDQDWQYSDKDEEKKPRSKRGRYFPKSVWTALGLSEKEKTNRKKRKSKGNKNASYTAKEAKLVRNA